MPNSFALVVCCFFLQGLLLCASRKPKMPNIVILFADDLGYGDLGCYGHPYATTPNIDAMARKGLRFTDFHAASVACAPSRAALLTGRSPIRSGVYPRVFTPSSIGGLPLNETTIAEYVKQAGYSTAIVGKWHLGIGQDGQYLPTEQGFDYYLGVPYSHSSCPCTTCFYPDIPCFDTCSSNPTYPPCPLYENTTIIEQPVDFTTLDDKYVNAATSFIKRESANKKPFFLYMAFHHPHYPQYAGENFTNSSMRGRYGDAINELDGAVGSIMAALKEAKVHRKTFVFFTSDNGPSLVREVRGGIPGPLKCGKGTTYEGGVREPAIAWWPRQIKRGKTFEMASTLDLLPTILKLTNVKAKKGVVLDGYDMGPILFKGQKSLRSSMFFHSAFASPEEGVVAMRSGQYKAHFITRGDSVFTSAAYPDPECRDPTIIVEDPPLLFDLYSDPSEVYTLPPDDPVYNQTMPGLIQMKNEINANIVWGESQIDRGEDPSLVPCASPGCTPFPSCCHT